MLRGCLASLRSISIQRSLRMISILNLSRGSMRKSCRLPWLVAYEPLTLGSKKCAAIQASRSPRAARVRLASWVVQANSCESRTEHTEPSNRRQTSWPSEMGSTGHLPIGLSVVRCHQRTSTWYL